MVDLDRVGDVPLILKSLLKQGLIHGDALTVSGRTMEEKLRDGRIWNEFWGTSY